MSKQSCHLGDGPIERTENLRLLRLVINLFRVISNSTITSNNRRLRILHESNIFVIFLFVLSGALG